MRVPLIDQPDLHQEEADRLLALDEALSRLVAADSQAAELVKLHVFGGLSIADGVREGVRANTRTYS